MHGKEIGMPYFTVFTPAYNRGYIISSLYDSLMAQSFTDFEWLLVDDGSDDNTESLVRQWMSSQDNRVRIRYMKKENGGKPRAINLGVSMARGKFFFMVDSDDRLHPDALAKMHRWCCEIENKPDYIGAGAARGYADGEYIKGSAPYVNGQGYIDATNLERSVYNLDADMCEAYKTDVFRQYPMAEWEGENFAPEQIALNEIALAGYKLRWHAEIIYYCDYLDDGLTKGSRRLEKNNPMGYAMMYNHMLKYPGLSGWQLFHTACQMTALSFYGRHPKYLMESNNKRMSALAFLPGMLLSVRRSMQFKNIS